MSPRVRLVVLGFALMTLGSICASPASAGTFDLTAVPANAKVTLDWPDLAGATSYDVYRNGSWAATRAAPDSFFTDGGKTNGTSYHYQVKAYKPATDGGLMLLATSGYADSVPGAGFGCFDLSTLAAGARPPACWRPFADSAPFNRKLPATPPLAANSAAVVAWMMGAGHQAPSNLLSNNGGYDYDHAVYFAKATDPSYTVHCTEDWGTCEPEGHSYRIPAQAKPAGWLASNPLDYDRHLSVVQPDGTTVDLWQASTPSGTGGTLNAAFGGVSTISGNGATGTAAVSANFGSAAGIIRGEELAAGKIDHALFAAVPCTNGQVYPAAGYAHQCPGTDAPPNGARLQLNMTEAQINALAVPSWKKTVLQALRTYGMVVGDTGGGQRAFSLEFESGAVYRSYGQTEKIDAFAIAGGLPTYTDPGIPGRTLHFFSIAPDVDWAGKLRVVQPCISDGTC